jgi:NADH-ubiquinone oxidoreductase chain 2
MLVLGIFSLMMAVALPTVRISPLLLIRVTSIILLYAAALSFNASYIQAIGSGVGIYSGLFQVTSLSQVIDTFIFVIAAFVILPWAPAKFITGSNVSMNVSQASIPEYSLIILFTTCGATFLISSADLVSMYLSIELQSFAVYILAALYRDSESATSAGLKYFLLGGLSSGLILLGSALVYSYTGLTSFEGIYSLLSVSTEDSITSAVTIGLAITVVGFLFKIAAAPFHNWAPDVYDGTPTIVTTWLTIMPKISILVFLLELQTGLSGVTLSLPIYGVAATFNVWKNLLLISSMLSLIIGTVVGLAQFRIKRLFAYSTISHVGFLLLALAINTEESIESFIFYLIQYSITNLNAFLILLAFGYVISQASAASNESTDIQFISQLKGQFRSNPLLGFSLAACLFSMAGIPPLMGFFAKQMVLYSATHAGYYFMSFVAIIVSVISAAYYLRIVRVIHFETSSSLTSGVSGQESQSTSTVPYITNVHSFTIATLTLAIALFVFKPSFILNSTHLLALSLFNA